ncbi:MAG: prolipoprotein diacylglyceryl transferase [bacterium]
MIEYPSWLHPVLLQVGFIEIRWYSLMYLVGFVVCYFLVPRLAKERGLELTRAAYDDMWIYFIVGAIVGGRLGFVLLFHPLYYFQHPLEIIAIWNGGMAFQGGFLGVVLMGILFSKKYKVSFFELADLFIIPLSIALFFGRFGNFANAELYGKVTELPWGVRFPDQDVFRHPTQIYEMLYNLVNVSIFVPLRKWLQKMSGALLALFLAFYAVERFIIELFRDTEAHLWGIITPAQIYCLVMLAGSIFILTVQLKHWRTTPISTPKKQKRKK